MAEASAGTAISVEDLHMSYGPNEAVRGIRWEPQTARG